MRKFTTAAAAAAIMLFVYITGLTLLGFLVVGTFELLSGNDWVEGFWNWRNTAVGLVIIVTAEFFTNRGLT